MLFLLTWPFILFAQESKDFMLVCTMFMFVKKCGKLMNNTSDSASFHCQGHLSLNGIFSIIPLAGLIRLKVYLKICHWILKKVFYKTGILFFLYIYRYGCFEAIIAYITGFREIITAWFHQKHFWLLKGTIT